jgi:amino acid adenylation domain-containing protein
MTSRPVVRPSNPFVEFPFEDTRQTLPDRFEQMVRRYPDRLAIKSPQARFSYDELNRAANRVAHAVLDRAGTEHEPVALFCGAGVSTIVASLAALKAGKAFVPLDRPLPRNRITEILASLDARVLLADEKSHAAAKSLTVPGLSAINIDGLGGNLSPDNPGLALSPESVAYINFTSGSTGEPKGVVWDHHRELYGIRTKTNALHLVPDDRVSLLRANNVGAARDMFLALLNGAALLTLDLDEAGLASLSRWLRKEEISVFSCVATVFRHAVRGASGSDSFPSVRLVHIGGEPVFKADVELYKRCFRDDCLLVNRYSISETQAVAYFFIDKQTAIDEERVPVGLPLEGSEVAILDDKGAPLGPRAVGEIAVRSPYLALGYWRQPELTRAKFIADPADINLRTYRTGDLGYRLPDGRLVHVGRKDFQAKIRGHRVEVSAVETALHKIPSVKQAVVVAASAGAKGDRLIAYVVAKNKRAVRRNDWRARLKRCLPGYMVPAQFVLLDSLPVTSGGKIDRRALAVPKNNSRTRSAPFPEPTSALEKLVQKLWREALKLDALGSDEDFTELGGDSLQAAEIIGHIKDLFPLCKPLVTLAETPSVAALTRFVLAQETKPGQSEKIATVFLLVESMSNHDVEMALARNGGRSSDG